MADHVLRLEPIEQPRGLMARIAYWYSRRSYGKVLAPLKVIYARKPPLMGLALKMQKVLEKKLTLDPALRYLVQLQVSQMNGCEFCHDIALAHAVRARIGAEKFGSLQDFRASSAYSDRERAALALAEEATRDRVVSEATWAAVKRNFNEVEVIELVWLNAVENYFNLQAAVLGIGSDRLAADHAPR